MWIALDRFRARALVLIGALAVAAGAPAAADERTPRGIDDRSAKVRVRPCLSRFPSPGVRGETLDCVPAGTRVRRLRTRDDWTLVRAPDGSVGWSLTRFLAAAEPLGDDRVSVARVRARPCLVRRPSPAATGRGLDCVRYGARVLELREYGGWTLARSEGGEVGWVESAFLTGSGRGNAAEPNTGLGAPTPASLPFVPSLKGRTAPRLGVAPPAPPTATRPPVAPDPAASRRLYPAATVDAEPCLRRRAVASPDAEVLDCLAHGAEVELIGRLDDWTQVRTPEGRLGWVPSERLAAGFGSPFLITDGDVGHVETPDTFDPEAAGDPAAEPGPMERGLEVDKWATSDEKPEGLVIVGLLRNMGSRINTAVTLTVKVYDWEERVVLEQPATVDTTILMPGQGTRFEVTLPGIFAFRAVEFDTSSVDFEVTDSELISTI